jgi:hypothetical protein
LVAEKSLLTAAIAVGALARYPADLVFLEEQIEGFEVQLLDGLAAPPGRTGD